MSYIRLVDAVVSLTSEARSQRATELRRRGFELGSASLRLGQSGAGVSMAP